MRTYIKLETAILILATFSLYLWMVLGPLANVSQMTNGMTPFDLMPSGYDLEYASELLNRLGEDGRHYYLTRQIPLDMFYPGMIALLLSKAWSALARYHTARAWIGPVALAGQSASWLTAVFDYSENVTIALLLTNTLPVSDFVITLASTLTQGKAIAQTLAATPLLFAWLLIGLIHLSARNRQRFPGRQPSVRISRI